MKSEVDVQNERLLEAASTGFNPIQAGNSSTPTPSAAIISAVATNGKVRRRWLFGVDPFTDDFYFVSPNLNT